MKAVIVRYHSSDIYELESYKPEQEDFFGFSLQMEIGSSEVGGEEIFELLVCTPRWIEEKLLYEDVVFGEHLLIVRRYAFDQIHQKLSAYVSQIEEDSWVQVALKIDRIAHWEYRDYQTE